VEGEVIVTLGGACAVSVKRSMAFGETPLEAVIVRLYTPPVPAAGVPDNVAVPFALSVKVNPAGRAPDTDNEGVGWPVAVTVKLPGRPTVNVAPAGLVIAGGTCADVSVSLSVAELLAGFGSVTPYRLCRRA
jgi:hypothetical protein